MESGITVRRATLDDVEELVRLRHDMMVEMGEHGEADADAIVEPMRDYFQKQLTGKHFTAFLAVDRGRIVSTGTFVVYDTPPSVPNPSGVDAYVQNMYTVPGYRGRGLAKQILDALLRQAYAEGARRIWLRTSEKARPVYQHLGFEPRDNYMQIFLREEPR